MLACCREKGRLLECREKAMMDSSGSVAELMPAATMFHLGRQSSHRNEDFPLGTDHAEEYNDSPREGTFPQGPQRRAADPQGMILSSDFGASTSFSFDVAGEASSLDSTSDCPTDASLRTEVITPIAIAEGGHPELEVVHYCDESTDKGEDNSGLLILPGQDDALAMPDKRSPPDKPLKTTELSRSGKSKPLHVGKDILLALGTSCFMETRKKSTVESKRDLKTSGFDKRMNGALAFTSLFEDWGQSISDFLREESPPKSRFTKSTKGSD